MILGTIAGILLIGVPATGMPAGTAGMIPGSTAGTIPGTMVGTILGIMEAIIRTMGDILTADIRVRWATMIAATTMHITTIMVEMVAAAQVIPVV